MFLQTFISITQSRVVAGREEMTYSDKRIYTVKRFTGKAKQNKKNTTAILSTVERTLEIFDI